MPPEPPLNVPEAGETAKAGAVKQLVKVPQLELLNVSELEKDKFPADPGPFAVKVMLEPLADAVTGELASLLKSAANDDATVLAVLYEG